VSVSEPLAVTALVIDDDELVRRVVCRVLATDGFTCAEAGDAETGLRRFRDEPTPLVVCDVQLPGRSGIETLPELRALDPEVAVLMISGRDDPEIADAATDHGAYGYLVKPFSPNELVISVRGALRRRELERDARRHRGELERQVDARTADLQAALEEVERSRIETIRRLMRAVELRDDDTGGHIERIGDLSAQLARDVGLGDEEVALLRLAAPMHDVGKIGIADAILRKPGRLTPEERTAMERHAELGHQLLTGSGSALLELAASVAWTHHERFDGGGYPRGLAGDAIPLTGRVVAVADVFDALTSDRVYRAAWPVDRALETMRAESGRHFDPDVLAALLDRVAV